MSPSAASGPGTACGFVSDPARDVMGAGGSGVANIPEDRLWLDTPPVTASRGGGGARGAGKIEWDEWGVSAGPVGPPGLRGPPKGWGCNWIGLNREDGELEI